MLEDAFERFRRLRDVSRTVSDGVQTQPTEDTASMSPLALFQALHACGVRLIPYPDEGSGQNHVKMHAKAEASIFQ